MNTANKVITLDMDGVVAGGEYTAEWDRTPAKYSSLPVIDGAKEAILDLEDAGYIIYYLSSRNFPQAHSITSYWMNRIGIPTGAGIITNVPLRKKGMVAESLGAILHVDDAPTALDHMENVKPILFFGRTEKSWWPGTRAAMRCYPSTDNWTILTQMIKKVI